MNLDVYNTHMELYPYKKDDYPVIEDMYTATDKFTGTDFACGYIIDDGKLYLPRGTSISKLESITGVQARFMLDSDPIEPMSRKRHSLYDPRDKIQEESIEFLKGEEHQLALNLKTGLGKTFCVAYAGTELGEKMLIITPNEGLKQQWINTFMKMFDYKTSQLFNITGSAMMENIVQDLVEERDIYFVNHQTLRNYLTQTNGYKFHQFFKKLNVGIKVYDESHMEFANILMIDFFSNTNRTWYLTATFDRSDKTESACFKKAFQSVIAYGEVQSMEVVEKHVVYHIVNINSRIDMKNRTKLMGYPGFSAAKFGRYAFFDDPNDSVYKTILKILELSKNTEGKTLIFVPLIDAVEEVVKKIKKNFPYKSVAAYHSKMSKDEKLSAEKKDIIVSTIKSCGTGKDISGLRCVINTEPFASKVVAEQTIGRLRPYAKDKDTFFFDIVTIDIAPCNWWFRGRFKKIDQLVKKVVTLNIDE